MHPICSTCGTQFAESAAPPERCPICDDLRQYVPPRGQSWTTLEALRRFHRNSFRRIEPRLFGIGMAPEFAIGQRALLIRSPGGNVLWDCVSLVDDATVDLLMGIGGLAAIAISHPHYYTTMVDWSRAFGGVPVYLHAADRAHVLRPDPVLHFWSGETCALHDSLTLIRCGGHFAGGAVLHWPNGAGGRGALLTGDILQVTMDRRFVSFMRSYPNLIPLPAPAVNAIVDAVSPFAYDRIYGAWWDRHIESDAPAVVERSRARYLAAIELPDPDADVV
jgi:hypothetical protein